MSIIARPSAVVCDMDGLLVDSERMERRVWQLAAQELGIELPDERFATFVGHSGDRNDALLRHYFGETTSLAFAPCVIAACATSSSAKA